MDFQQRVGYCGNMIPTNTHSDKKTTIQMPTPGRSDNVTPNQRGSGTNQGTNGDN